ncbi:MAG: transposase, partial [Deltaproteobacteria bacterium]|nr:transposase [Deltaproteobacteria bacterium]
MLPVLPELAQAVSSLYDRSAGRPSSDLVTMTGANILGETFDWTVKETLGRVRSDTEVHRALGLGCDPSDRKCVISENTFYDFRDKFPEVDGPWHAAMLTTKHFCQTYSAEVKVVRFDSTDVRSNIRDLNTRGALFQECLFYSVRELLRAFPGAEHELAPEIRNRYDRSRKIGYDPFAQASRGDKPCILHRMAGDVESIVRQFRFIPASTASPGSGSSKGFSASSAPRSPARTAAGRRSCSRTPGTSRSTAPKAPTTRGRPTRAIRRRRAARSSSPSPAARLRRTG